MKRAPTVLLLPGLGDSGPEHWQSRWQAAHPEYRRVVQRDWDTPDLADWIATLDAAIAAIEGPVVPVAHSLACALIAHWAQRHRGDIAGALLVSPSDVDSPAHTPEEVRGFAPLPLARLPFPSILVYSSTDPYIDPFRAVALGNAWGSRVVDAGDAGHINTDSGHGPWPGGHALLRSLLG